MNICCKLLPKDPEQRNINRDVFLLEFPYIFHIMTYFLPSTVTVGTSEVQKLGNIFLQVLKLTAFHWLLTHTYAHTQFHASLFSFVQHSLCPPAAETGGQKGEFHRKRLHGWVTLCRHWKHFNSVSCSLLYFATTSWSCAQADLKLPQAYWGCSNIENKPITELQYSPSAAFILFIYIHLEWYL